MVHYRPDPRGVDPKERMRWNLSLGPYNRHYFEYAKFRYMDWAIKYPRNCIGFTIAIAGASYFVYNVLCFHYGANTMTTRFMNHAERQFEYIFHSQDRRGTRGTWDNIYKCWSDSPDCRKDFKIKYTA